MDTKPIKFSINDLVFAKVRGFIPWPAKITKHKSKRYVVYFYGTGQTGTINFEHIYPYVESKKIYATETNLKRQKFRKGIEEIELALNEKYSELDNSVNIKECRTGDTFAIEDNTEITVVGIEKPTAAKLTKSNERKFKRVTRSGKNISTNHKDDQPRKGKRNAPAEGSRVKLPHTATSQAKRIGTKAEMFNLLLVASKNDLIGIKLDYNKPQTFIDSTEEKKWEDNAWIEAEDLKDRIVLGLVKIEDLKDRIIVNPEVSKIRADAVTRFTNEMIDQEAALFDERDFEQLCMELKECIRLDRAYTSRSLEILDNCKELRLTPVMLKRNVSCVDIIRCVRKYVGNTAFWNLQPEERTSFEMKADSIRSKATFLYTNFQRMFEVPPGERFWPFFCKEVDSFKGATKHISFDNRILMTDKMYKNITKLKKESTPELKSHSNKNAANVQSCVGNEKYTYSIETSNTPVVSLP